MRDVTNGHHPNLGVALDHLLSSGGKRIRPALALLTGEMLGAERNKIISLAAAIELLHTATLVHDDLIDGALLRRGIPTLNAQWTPGATVLTGDFIFACAAKLASETESADLICLFAETLATIVNGEITQMFPRLSGDYFEEYFNRIYAKTASLFELATIAPAILSPLRETSADAAKQFGYGIGMAFQIIDDVLDFTGKQTAVGKPVANDLRQGLIQTSAQS
jgi:geranylgeranyl pyrophosphate synthase